MSPVDSYLAELERELRARKLDPERILAEVEDHLRSSAADAGEAAALARFGAAAELAEGLARTAAGRAGGVAALATAAGTALLLVLCAAAALLRRRHPWLDGFPAALAPLGVEVAAVAALAAGGRVLLARRGVVVSQRGVAGSALVAALALAAAAAALAFPAARDVRQLDAGGGLALLAAISLLAIVAAAAIAASARSLRRARALTDDTPPFADVAAATAWAAALAGRAAPGPAGRLAGHPRLTAWLDPAGHPWRFCGTVAAAALLAVSLAGAVQGGDPSPVVGALQAAAVVAGFALLGPALGLRPRGRP